MRSKGFLSYILLAITLAAITAGADASGQIPGESGRRYRVVDGILQEVRSSGADSMQSVLILSGPERELMEFISAGLREEADSLVLRADSLVLEDPNFGHLSDSLRRQAAALIDEADSFIELSRKTELTPVEIAAEEAFNMLGNEPIPADSLLVEQLSRRQLKRQERMERYADSTFVRHNAIFRDSIPISRMTWISVVAPGFSQLYNSQAWKIPILYGTVGTSAYFAFKENKSYRYHRARYDGLIYLGIKNREELDYHNERMLKHNTRRQLLFGAAAASYIYFLGDGVMNYTNQTTNVKIATTLSTICPGAGQIYNRSYWHVPFVLGGTAALAYTIDWNNRGYQRFKLAYDLRTSAEEAGDVSLSTDEFMRNGSPYVSTESLRNYKNSYRRNRDLCIIFMGVLYLVNIIDAHVDAHMKDYDISDDLNISLEPAMTNIYLPSRGNTNMMGLNFRINF